MSSPRTPVILTAALVVVLSLSIVPVLHVQLSASSSFMPALFAAVGVFDLVTIYLLVGDFRDRGDRRTIAMAVAYTWSLVLMLGYAMAFPGAVLMDAPLASTSSTAPYLYLTWHCGFPALLAVAWAPWPLRFTWSAPVHTRARIALASTVGAVLAGAATVALWYVVAADLPPLIKGNDTSLMTSTTRLVVGPLMALVLLVTVRGTWRRTGPEKWVSVAIVACLCDLALTYGSGSRYTVGWYAGRSMIVVASGVVLAAMLAAFSRIKAQAERDAFHDPLTQLLNRRGAFAALDTMIVKARANGYPLGVVTLDLDLFKTINDLSGHEAGDRALVEVGRVLDVCSRAGDVAARTGGEEFLVILDDTDAAGVLVAAERLRSLIEEVTVPGVDTAVTASFGVTVLEQDDPDHGEVLRRADRALFDAKHNGRNRVESRFLDRSTSLQDLPARLSGS